MNVYGGFGMIEIVHGNYEQRNLTQLATGQARVGVRVDLGTVAKKILATTATCFVTGVEKAETEIRVSGKTITRVLFVDEHDGYNSEEHTDEFVERFTPKNMPTVHSVTAMAEIVQSAPTKTTKNESDQINAVMTEHTINIAVNGLEESSVSFVKEIRGNVETMTDASTISTWGETFNDKFEIGETFTLDDNIDGIMGVDVNAYVRDITVSDGKFTVKGVASVTVTELKSVDVGHTISNSLYNFDFAKTFNKKNIGANDLVFGGVVISNVGMKVEHRNQAELVIEAELTFVGHSVIRHEIKAVTDAFSVAHNLDFTTATSTVVDVIPQSNISADIEGNVTMGDSAPYIARVMWASGLTSSNINVKPVEDKVVIEGVLNGQILYQCEEGGLHNHAIQVPFSVNCKIDGVRDTHSISASVTALSCNVKARRGKELLVDARIGVSAFAVADSAVKLISDVIIGADKPQGEHAITVHVASPGETVWDVAKRTNTSTAEIMRQNPTLEQGIRDGDRIVIFNQAV